MTEPVDKARMRDGSAYSGTTMYQGNGFSRSCGRCHKFRIMTGSRKHSFYGLICADCVAAKAKAAA